MDEATEEQGGSIATGDQAAQALSRIADSLERLTDLLETEHQASLRVARALEHQAETAFRASGLKDADARGQGETG